jgi:membrane associated rhomboid family serine protease
MPAAIGVLLPQVAMKEALAAVWQRLRILFALIGLLCVIHLVNMATNYHLNRFGVVPGQQISLSRIVIAPFIHGSLSHLANNLMLLAVFSFLCLLRPVKFYIAASALIIVCSGLAVWQFARPGVHIGASGWIFGLWAMSIALAFFERRVVTVCVSVLVILVYGGMIRGVLPQSPYVSYEYHLFGAIAGVMAAAVIPRVKWLRA